MIRDVLQVVQVPDHDVAVLARIRTEGFWVQSSSAQGLGFRVQWLGFNGF